MPVIPLATAPYDTVESVLEFARVIIADFVQNDTANKGDVLSDTQPYTLPLLNLAWRKLQKKLASAGHPKLTTEANITSLPVVYTVDPAVQVSISWTGFSDGLNVTATPLLPNDLIMPLRLWERMTGTVEDLQPMRLATDGLPMLSQGSRMGLWEWRDDVLYMPGAIVNVDLRVRYAAALADLSILTGPVPILRSAEALAYYIAELFAEPRGGAAAAQSFAAKGDLAVEALTEGNAKLQQRGSFRRVPFGGRRSR